VRPLATLSEDGKMADLTDPCYESYIVYTDTDMCSRLFKSFIDTNVIYFNSMHTPQLRLHTSTHNRHTTLCPHLEKQIARCHGWMDRCHSSLSTSVTDMSAKLLNVVNVNYRLHILLYCKAFRCYLPSIGILRNYQLITVDPSSAHKVETMELLMSPELSVLSICVQ
jgi:hypothetical protein